LTPRCLFSIFLFAQKGRLNFLFVFGRRNYTHDKAIALLDLLEERYRKGPVIVTSQVEPSGWLKLFKNAVIGEALVDRLIHLSQKLTLKCARSYREKLKDTMSDLRKTRVVQ